MSGQRMITHAGETLSLRQWAKRIGMTKAGLHHRLSRWPLEVALVVSPMKRGKHIGDHIGRPSNVTLEQAVANQQAREAAELAEPRPEPIDPRGRPVTLIHGLSGGDLPVSRVRRIDCPACERPFTPSEGRRITCSDACRSSYVADWPFEIDDPEVSSWDEDHRPTNPEPAIAETRRARRSVAGSRPRRRANRPPPAKVITCAFCGGLALGTKRGQPACGRCGGR